MEVQSMSVHHETHPLVYQQQRFPRLSGVAWRGRFDSPAARAATGAHGRRTFARREDSRPRIALVWRDCPRAAPIGCSAPHDQPHPVCYARYIRAMPTISHRDMRNNSSEVLREVEAGASYTVTNRGKPVAVLAPLAGGTPSVAPTRPALRQGGFGELRRHRVDGQVASALDELRGER